MISLVCLQCDELLRDQPLCGGSFRYSGLYANCDKPSNLYDHFAK